MIPHFRYVYGPVYSWRLGNSLGVDPLSCTHKICNMNCNYCQLGKTAELSFTRKEFVAEKLIIEEIESIPAFAIDYITFSGRGEPTLAKNLGAMIRGVQAIRKEKIAVITNSILLDQKDVQDDLMTADFVLAKLDACHQDQFSRINGCEGIELDGVIKGLAQFRKRYQGKFALQIMIIKDNLEYLQQLGSLANLLNPDEIQLNTPRRAGAEQPIGKSRLQKAKNYFKGLPVVSCYDVPINHVEPLDSSSTVMRHGKYRQKVHAS